MSEQKHTPEPWRVDTYFNEWIERDAYNVKSSETYVIGDQGLFLSAKEDEANARRIVACVNACEGIATEALENDDFDQIVNNLILDQAKKSHDRQRKEIDQLKAERDELLAALEMAYRNRSEQDKLVAVVSRFNSVIAKIKGAKQST